MISAINNSAWKQDKLLGFYQRPTLNLSAYHVGKEREKPPTFVYLGVGTYYQLRMLH